MKEFPLVSIVVPIYNLSDCMDRCIESLKSQQLKEIEIILVNDGSTDGSGIKCEAYALLDPRIKVIHQENGGISAARNIGIEAAKGKYIGFVDGDDWVYPTMFHSLYHSAENTRSDITICACDREIDGTLIEVRSHDFSMEMSNEEALYEMFRGKHFRYAAWNKLYRASLFQDIRFPVGQIHEDLATTYKLFLKADKITHISEAGYVYVKREGSTVNSGYNRKRINSIKTWDEIIATMNQNYRSLETVYMKAYCFWVLDHMHMIIADKTLKDKNQYLSILQQSLKNNYKSLKTNIEIPFTHKIKLAALLYYPPSVKWKRF